jgi:protein-S-isoprenylcysteine O-methyltransferase Ste14
MNDLAKQALTGTLKFHLVLALLIFGPALTLNYWQGWLFLFILLACTLPITLYLLRYDPALVVRRIKAGPAAESRGSQKLIQALAMILMCAVIVTSSLDHQFVWSAIPWPYVIFGDALVVAAFVFVFWVFRENSFAASTITVAAGQRVISTGPYALVRHPMYAGALPGIFGSAIALGSWWGLLPAALLTGVIIWRLLDEEKYLAQTLPGYADYQRKLRWRLFPLLW